MKVSASFLSSNNIPEDLTKLNNTDVDYIHVDIMDGKFVPNKTMPFREMKHIYEYTSKRLDVHLMVEDPSKYIPLYAELNTEYITIHVEIEEDILKDLEMIKDYSIKCGLAISPDTKVSELIPYLPYLDYILVMSVYPGKGGQKFIPSIPYKLEHLKKLRDEKNSNFIIHVDGGINKDTIKYVKDYVDMFVCGSYICCSDDYQAKIDSLLETTK